MEKSRTFVESHANEDMMYMLMSMEPHLENATGKFGYAIARNVRKIKDACTEYLQIRQDLITQFGTEQVDENGNKTGAIELKIGSDAYNEFKKQLDEYSEMKYDVEILKIPYETLPKDITAKDMLNLEWMLIDGE